jgi:hypothetical protein
MSDVALKKELIAFREKLKELGLETNIGVGARIQDSDLLVFQFLVETGLLGNQLVNVERFPKLWEAASKLATKLPQQRLIPEYANSLMRPMSPD